MKTDLPMGTMVRHRSTATMVAPGFVFRTLIALTAASFPVAAKPLDAETCAKLKVERDALEAAGTRSALKEQPPARPVKTLDDRTQKLAKLIQLDGQLRFRCNMELPISSLRPELMMEVPDTVDGEPVVKPVPRKALPKKAKAAPVDKTATNEPGTAPPKRTKAAASKAEQPAEKSTSTAATTEPPTVKARPKAKAKIDDAYRPTTKTDDSN